MKTCEHLVNNGARCIALALPRRSKCSVHFSFPDHKAKPAESWPAGQPFPIYWKDAEPRLVFDTPWEV